MVACPKCGRQVQPKRTCIYCGTVLSSAPATVLGLDAAGWVQEGQRFSQNSQYDRAIGCFDKALTINPKHAAAWSGKARALATRGERDEAVKCLNEALAIDPNDGQLKALRGRLAQMPQGLPPGRPSTDSMASSIAREERTYHSRATAELYGSLELIAGPQDMMATNWVCAVPPNVGWPGAAREVTVHAFTKDTRAFSFYLTKDARSVPATRISDAELAGWGALLQSGRVHGACFGANVVWSPAMRARVDAVNARLEGLGAKSGARIELIVVAAG